jgi:hypothetical protein
MEERKILPQPYRLQTIKIGSTGADYTCRQTQNYTKKVSSAVNMRVNIKTEKFCVERQFDIQLLWEME